MEKLEKINEIIKDLNEVSNLYKDAAILRKQASQKNNDATDNRKKAQTIFIEALDLLKTSVDSWGDELQNQVNNKIKEAQTLLEKAGLNASEIIKANQQAENKEKQANTKWKDVSQRIASFYEECEIIEGGPSDKDSEALHNEKKKLLDSLKAFCVACQMKDAASQTREMVFLEMKEESLRREKESKKRYEEVKDIIDNKEKVKKVKDYKKEHFTKKRTHCYGFLGVLTIVWLCFAGNLLGFPLGIDIGSSDTPKYVVLIVLLCIVLIFILCIIIVLSRRLHRINKALLKIDALIMRMELSTDRDLGKPYRLDRELEMIYRILES